jgi:uncharacterized protein (DUF697 family)
VAAATAAASGPLAPVAELVVLTWTHAELVLHIAAAHGHDPTDRARAVDLLTLLRLHPSPETARDAVAEAVAASTSAVAESTPSAAPAIARLAAPLALRSAGWRLRRMASRLAPGAGGLLAIAEADAATEGLAHRAARHFREAATAS